MRRALAYTALLLAGATAASAQETENPQVIVQAEAGEIPSAYGAPPDPQIGYVLVTRRS